MSEQKGRCPCGLVASGRSLDRHAAQCPDYLAAYRAGAKLDLVRDRATWLEAKDERDRVKMEDRGADREQKIVEREAERRSRWQSGSRGAPRERQVATPADGVVGVPSRLVGTARAAALGQMRLVAP